MLFVILFHVALDRGDPFYGLRRCGNVGVDIFLFLSGVGLWFAWTKTPSVSHFYRRRLIRILPTWLICSTAFYLPDYLGAQRFSKNVVDLLEVETRAERHEERDEQQPHRIGRQLPARAYHFAHVDADEEDGHTTPEYLQVSHDGMYRQYPLHHYAPHHH